MSIEIDEKQSDESRLGEEKVAELVNGSDASLSDSSSPVDANAASPTPGTATKKRVKFPDELIQGYSDPPRRWNPGEYSTFDLLASYLKACSEQKTKPMQKLVHQLRALQDLQGINGEKVNVLNLNSE